MPYELKANRLCGAAALVAPKRYRGIPKGDRKNSPENKRS
jgi:hypothetical protein